jgi:hypothetical protein
LDLTPALLLIGGGGGAAAAEEKKEEKKKEESEEEEDDVSPSKNPLRRSDKVGLRLGSRHALGSAKSQFLLKPTD